MPDRDWRHRREAPSPLFLMVHPGAGSLLGRSPPYLRIPRSYRCEGSPVSVGIMFEPRSTCLNVRCNCSTTSLSNLPTPPVKRRARGRDSLLFTWSPFYPKKNPRHWSASVEDAKRAKKEDLPDLNRTGDFSIYTLQLQSNAMNQLDHRESVIDSRTPSTAFFPVSHGGDTAVQPLPRYNC